MSSRLRNPPFVIEGFMHMCCKVRPAAALGMSLLGAPTCRDSELLSQHAHVGRCVCRFFRQFRTSPILFFSKSFFGVTPLLCPCLASGQTKGYRAATLTSPILTLQKVDSDSNLRTNLNSVPDSTATFLLVLVSLPALFTPTAYIPPITVAACHSTSRNAGLTTVTTCHADSALPPPLFISISS